MNIKRVGLLAVAIASQAMASVEAGWIGADTGTAASYTTSGNWNGGTVDNNFSAVTLTGDLLLPTPNFSTSTSFNFDYSGAFNITFQGDSGARTITLGADTNVSFQPNGTGRTFTAGTNIGGTNRLLHFSTTTSATFTIGAGNTWQQNGQLMGGKFVKQGAGTMNFNRGTGNSWTEIDVQDGKFVAQATNWNPSGTRSVTVGSSGTFENTATQSNAINLSLNGGAVDNSGSWSAVTLSSTGGGTLTNNSTFTLGGNVSYIAGGAGNTLTLAGPIALGATRTFTVANGSKAIDVDVTGILSGTSQGVTKAGAGVMRLSGANTYTGATSVSAGVLLVDGSTAAGSAVSVDSGAVFGGNGTVDGSLTLSSGALFAFDPADTLTLGGSSTFALDSTFGVGSLRDRSGAAIDWGSIGEGSYTLITGGNLSANFFNATNISNFGAANAFDIGGGRNAYFDNGSLTLVVAVPEPSAVLLGGLGLAVTGWAARRRRRGIGRR